MIKNDTIFYIYDINKIGGIETFIYEIAKEYKDRDIAVIYKAGDKEQVDRLKQYIKVIKWNGEPVECVTAYFNLMVDIIDSIKATKYIQLIHADYVSLKYKPELHPKINEYIAVSKVAGESFKKLTGAEVNVVYNPIKVEKPKKVLRLISATRLTADKR